MVEIQNIPEESIKWLDNQLLNSGFGEVGISFVVHNGSIVKVIKKLEEKKQCLSH